MPCRVARGLAAGGGQQACKDLYLGGIEAPCRPAPPAPLTFVQIDSPEYPRETFPQSSDYIRHADSGTVFVVTGTISAPITCRGEPRVDSRTRPTRGLRYRTHRTTPQAANKQARGPLASRGCHVEWRQGAARRQRLPHDSEHRLRDHLRATHLFASNFPGPDGTRDGSAAATFSSILACTDDFFTCLDRRRRNPGGPPCLPRRPPPRQEVTPMNPSAAFPHRRSSPRSSPVGMIKAAKWVHITNSDLVSMLL